MDNPYSTPSVETLGDARGDAASSQPFSTMAREIFVAWERLRFVYVAILGVVTIGLAMSDVSRALMSVAFWGTVFVGALVANVCYFAGPIAETYVSWLGYRATWLRMTLFILGTLLSCMLAFGVVAAHLLPP